jgi:hypothetical protein
MRQIMCLLLAKSSLCPDAFDDPQAFAQGSFQDLGVAPTHSSSPDAHLAHEPLVDRKRRLHLSHISILPYRGGIRLVPSPYGGFLHRILGKAWIVQKPPRVLVGGGSGRAEDGAGEGPTLTPAYQAVCQVATL